MVAGKEEGGTLRRGTRKSLQFTDHINPWRDKGSGCAAAWFDDVLASTISVYTYITSDCYNDQSSPPDPVFYSIKRDSM